MSESKFRPLQEEVCFKPPEEQVQEPDKICPTCIPNESYMEPDWTRTTEPYLNEKTCEYHLKVVINVFGDVYVEGAGDSIITKGIANSEYPFNVLLKTYVRPAVRGMLRFYGKLETDEIVCARPPTAEGEKCGDIFGLNYENYVTYQDQVTDNDIPSAYTIVNTLQSITSDLPQIRNLGALELFARVKDYTFLPNSRMLAVLISIPAYKFDAVPDAPDLGSLNTGTEKVILKPPEFMIDINLFKTAMKTFSSYQSYFKHEENGRLYEAESNLPFYIKFYADERIDKFVSNLDDLLDKNGFDLRGFLNTGIDGPNIPQEIEISFDKTDETKPFTVQNVRARLKNCPFVECLKGLETFINYSKDEQTMLGYISNFKDIVSRLRANKTPPWLDFIVANTFPQLAVNYGSMGNYEDECEIADFSQLDDFILNEVMEFSKAFAYRLNQNACKTPDELISLREALKDFENLEQNFGLEDGISKVKKVYSAKAKQLDALLKDLEEKSKQLKKFVAKRKAKKSSSSFAAGLTAGAGISAATKPPTKFDIKKVLEFLNPCNLNKTLKTSMKCIMAGLSAEEAYYAIIKEVLNSAGEEALEIVLQTLPANKQQQIRAEVEKSFKDMPYPWDPGWESGNLGNVVDRQTRENINKKEARTKQADEEYNSLERQIGILRSRIEELNNPELESNYQDRIIEQAQLAQNQQLNLRQQNSDLEREIGIHQQDLEIAEILIREGEIKIQFVQNNFPGYLWDNNPDYIQGLEEKRLGQEQKTENETLIANKRAQIDANNSSIATLQQQINTLTTTSLEQFREATSAEIAELEKQIADLEKKQLGALSQASPEARGFSELSDEEQQEIVDEQKERTRIVRTTPSDEVQQGTLGRSFGNIQKALTQAYIDEIMKSATIGELRRAVDAIPGGDVIGKLVGKFKCANTPLVYPPIESFLSTLTFDPCGTEKTRFSLPTIQEIPYSFNFLEVLGDAFYGALKGVISRVLMALMMKVAELASFEGPTCSDVVNVGLEATRNGGFEDALRDFFCGEDLGTDKSAAKVLGATAGSASPQSYQKLTQALSVSSTLREVKQAMIGEAPSSYIEGISTIVKAAVPEFSSVFADSQATSNFFERMGNLLTHQQRQSIIDSLDLNTSDYPVETSICLTKEDKELWDSERAGAFTDPELGREFVDKQNEKALGDLADSASILFNGPEGRLSEELDRALASKDPDCKVNKSVVPGYENLPMDKQTAVSNAIEGIFKRLEKGFIDDVIGWQWFNPFNTIGLISLILSDRKNRPLNHYLYAKNAPFFLRFLFGGDSELPDTVGIQMREQLENLGSDYDYRRGFRMHFDNEKAGDDNYKSLITLDDTRAGFTYNIQDELYSLNINNNYEVPEDYQPISDETSDEFPSRVISLRKLFEKNWSDLQNVNISDSNSRDAYAGINQDIYKNFIGKLLLRRNGELSQGFVMGNKHVDITEEDLTYVGPNGEEPYSDFYSEEDAVLGRSKTSNPRVHFLDPAKYGGTYTEPQIYIEEAQHEGWLQFSKIVVPDPTGCDPKNSNFLMLGTIMEQINKNKSRIPNHEGLSTAPECTKELPFDKIANGETMATLEGIVRATIRVYISDFLIRTLPIYANINMDIERNFDNAILQFIVENISKGLIDERSIFSSTYEGYTYFLLFLEQVVQIVNRKIKDGSIEANDEIDAALEACNSAQERHIHITSDDLNKIRTYDVAEPITEYLSQKLSQEQLDIYNDEVDQMVDAVKRGISIIGSGDSWLDIFEALQFNIGTISLEQARFASKIYSIYTVEQQCKSLLKYIVKEELDFYKNKISEEFSPRPYVYDVSKYFIGDSSMLLGKKITAGVYDTEVPIGGGVSNFPYGEIVHCARESMQHPLNGTSLDFRELKDLEESGAFYLEKYLIVKEKKGFEIPENIRDTTSVVEFKEFLQSKFGQFAQGEDSSKNISEYFGDAAVSEDGLSYSGTIGVKFGVRLCYVPPKTFAPFTNLPDELANRQLAKKRRSYILSSCSFEGGQVYQNAKFSFPVASYEQDILDVKISDILNSDDNLNQELKCYVDKLTETEEFTHLMKNIIILNKIPSSLMIYSYKNFLFSLGKNGSEREDGDDENPLEQDQLGKVFNDSRREARKLFASYYKNNDRDPPSEEENNTDLVSQFQKSLTESLSFTDFGSIGLPIKRRIRRSNPFDKDGKECKNNFGKLFTIGVQ